LARHELAHGLAPPADEARGLSQVAVLHQLGHETPQLLDGQFAPRRARPGVYLRPCLGLEATLSGSSGWTLASLDSGRDVRKRRGDWPARRPGARAPAAAGRRSAADREAGELQRVLHGEGHLLAVADENAVRLVSLGAADGVHHQ